MSVPSHLLRPRQSLLTVPIPDSSGRDLGKIGPGPQRDPHSVSDTYVLSVKVLDPRPTENGVRVGTPRS